MQYNHCSSRLLFIHNYNKCTVFLKTTGTFLSFFSSSSSSSASYSHSFEYILNVYYTVPWQSGFPLIISFIFVYLSHYMVLGPQTKCNIRREQHEETPSFWNAISFIELKMLCKTGCATYISDKASNNWSSVFHVTVEEYWPTFPYRTALILPHQMVLKHELLA